MLKDRITWWREQPVLDEKSLCPLCNSKQNMNWYMNFDKFLVESGENPGTFDRDCEQICELYKRALKFMSDYHEQKMDMAETILKTFTEGISKF